MVIRERETAIKKGKSRFADFDDFEEDFFLKGESDADNADERSNLEVAID